MRTQTQPLQSILCDDLVAYIDNEDVDLESSRKPTPLQTQIDGVREAIRLDQLELEYFAPSRIDTQSIRVNIARLRNILPGLLALSARSANRCDVPETEDCVLRDSAMSKSYLISANFGHGACTTNARYATVADALMGASELLDDGVPAVGIVDSDGKLILPADQVSLRLHPTPEYVFQP